MSRYKGFYKKSIAERLDILKDDLHIDADNFKELPASTYNNMIENAITTFELPMGVAPNFLINGIQRVIPMVTEEPSVIAAASNAANIIKRNGGFTSIVTSRCMRGEIIFMNPNNSKKLKDFITHNTARLFEQAALAHPSIVKRNGGLKHIEIRDLDETLIVDLIVDTKEAMGANIINTILERLKTFIQEQTQETALMAILTNLTPECIVEASCTIDPKTLRFPDEIANRIQDASILAHKDPYRTATHNKGIMNGLDAVLIATGNDWRAVNAGLYAYHSQDGILKPFTTWSINPEGMIEGKAKLPLAIGTVGGSIGLNPKVVLSYQILGTSDAQTVMECLAAVALAQNFAALYALTTDGIQKGHMALHARNLALKAGAASNELEQVVAHLLKQPHLNSTTATESLNTIRTQSKRQ